MELNWHAIGIGITTCIAVVGANAWIMKLVIDNAILKFGKAISNEYVTKGEFKDHIQNCPAKLKV